MSEDSFFSAVRDLLYHPEFRRRLSRLTDRVDWFMVPTPEEFIMEEDEYERVMDFYRGLEDV